MELLKDINSPADLKKVKIDKLPQVAAELRTFILDTVSKLGGHLASSLGSADITIALHYVFDTPKDKLVRNTRHQTNSQKNHTGHHKKMHTIRQFGGLSGFLKRNESEYD